MGQIDDKSEFVARPLRGRPIWDRDHYMKRRLIAAAFCLIWVVSFVLAAAFYRHLRGWHTAVLAVIFMLTMPDLQILARSYNDYVSDWHFDNGGG